MKVKDGKDQDFLCFSCEIDSIGELLKQCSSNAMPDFRELQGAVGDAP